MTREEERIRARRRERGKEAMMVRRILFSVCLLIILGLCIYGYRNHKRVQTLGGKIDQLEQQLKQNKTDRENLRKELDDLQKELQEKQKELEKIQAALYDDPEKPNVYLTFDDGPSSLTEKYLDILKKHKIHATFFLIGQQVEEMPEIVERELKEGHEIGVHTYTHESCEIYASCQAYYEDVNKVRDVLEKRFDYKPQLWRFPWGSANCYIHSYKEEIIQRLGEQNMEYADWNVSAEDSVGSPTVDSILRNVKKDAFRVKDPVVLMHDSGSNQATLDSLEAVITLFEEQGYRFETMSQRENCCHFGQ